MTNQYLTGLRTACLCAAIVAVVFVPLTSTLAQQSFGDGGNGQTAVQDAGDRMMQPRLYPRANYVWPYATGPFYGHVPAAVPGTLATSIGSFHLSQGALPFPEELKTPNRLGEIANQHFIVQLHPDLDTRADILAKIEAAGGAMVERLKGDAMIVRLNAQAHASIADAVGILAVEPFHAAFKLSPGIGREPLPDPLKAMSTVYTLDVRVWDAARANDVAAKLTGLGAVVNRVSGNFLSVDADRSLLAQIAQIEEIGAIAEDLPVLLRGEETTTTMQTGRWNNGAIPYHDVGLDGGGGGKLFCDPNVTDGFYKPCDDAGDCTGDCTTPAQQVLMVLDTGLQLDAGDLSDTREDPGTAGAAHRKVRIYETTNDFGGFGDELGCDAPQQGGFTHGHMVTTTAIGNATAVDPAYGLPWQASDEQGNPWSLDGVADHGVVVMYDAEITNPSASCSDPLMGSLLVGDLWNAADENASSLGKSYNVEGARVTNFSWGATSNTYDEDARDVDLFIEARRDAMVFISAGNTGMDENNDGIPDPLSLGSPATTKNGLAIGATYGSNNNINNPESRASFSSVGPAIDFETVNRIAPQLMAPGGEPVVGRRGVVSEWSCRSSDNDQTGLVECDVAQDIFGTSFSSPAAAGAALVVRDYFSQGWYPDKDPSDEATRTDSISGALVKAMLVASADFMGESNFAANLFERYRWNNEQGYGRIQLNHVLPIPNDSRSPSGIIVHDPWSNTSNMNLTGSLGPGIDTDSDTFKICNDTEELRVALVWTDVAQPMFGQGELLNDLNLTLTAPSGREYRGNYFTDDNNRNNFLDTFPVAEDCPGYGERFDDPLYTPEISQGPWSLATCSRSRVPGPNNAPALFDTTNPIEAIFLSPDAGAGVDTNDPDYFTEIFNLFRGTCDDSSSKPLGVDGFGACGNDLDCSLTPESILATDICRGGTKQPEIGNWTIKIDSIAGNTAQDFAVVIAGGVCLNSSVRFTTGAFTCNAPAEIQVTEVKDVLDCDCNEADGCPDTVIEARTTVRAYDGGVEVDCEGPACLTPSASLNFTQVPGADVFVSDAVNLTDGTVPTPGNGSLDVRDGYRVEVTYADVEDTDCDNDPPDPEVVERVSTANVGCQVAIGFGSDVFVQWGQDMATNLEGGCERAELRFQLCDTATGMCQDGTIPPGGCKQDLDCPLQAQGFFEYGFPDQYMDAGESVQLNVGFNSDEPRDLDNITAGLRCVNVDADSPVECLPSGAGCVPADCGPSQVCDPRRLNNSACPYMDILNSPQFIGFVPSGALASANYAIQMGDDNLFNNESATVEMVLEVTANTAGKTASGLAVSRQRLNVDAVTKLYNTDFPTGGMDAQVLDMNGNEREDNPINDLAGFQGFDYRFETRSYSDMTVGGKNANLQSPWNFDGNDGGFTNGLNATTDVSAQAFNIANWGEDKNFNGVQDGVCATDRAVACYRFPTDPRCPGAMNCETQENNNLDTDVNVFTQNHNTLGGCGWQTKAPHSCTAIEERGCFDDDDCKGSCQLLSNQILSSMTPCSGATCPEVGQCNEDTSTTNVLGSCSSDANCGGVPDSCEFVDQLCRFDGGTCDLGSTAATGGIWHSGQIGDDTSASDCEDVKCVRYKVITTADNILQWWEILATPVMEKVDTTVLPDGLNQSTIEIAWWAWNQSIDLSDNNMIYTWEFDTDKATIFPVDLFADRLFLNAGNGEYGAVSSGSNPNLTNGWNLFAPMGKCMNSTGACRDDTECAPGTCDAPAGGEPCHFDGDCDVIASGALCLNAEPCIQQDFSYNATDNSTDPDNPGRQGENSCFFEGAGAENPIAEEDFHVIGTALPIDNDVDDDNDGFTDEYVSAAGPIRNHDIVAFNGPDMRLFTLEDLYQDTGDSFQAGIGMLAVEGQPGNVATRSYGLGVDDMVVEWFEYRLDPDETDCVTGGACAAMEVPSFFVYEGVNALPVSLLDPTPYGKACFGGDNPGEVCQGANGDGDCPGGGFCVPATNDCDLNGKYNEGPDSDDCNDNGTPDVVVQADSEVEFGEIVVLDRVGPEGSGEYAGTLPISTLVDSVGVLFLSQVGDDDPSVSLTYRDNNDRVNEAGEAIGYICQNSVVPEQQGRVGATALVQVINCDVQVLSTSFSDNGDSDLFIDSQETISLDFTVQNNCGFDLTNCVARLSSNSEQVECIKSGTVVMGTIEGSTTGTPPVVPSPDSFTFKLDDLLADRTEQGKTSGDEFDADFNIAISCTEIGGVQFPQDFSLPMDLNLNDNGATPGTWIETFEGGAGGNDPPNIALANTAFFAENIDAGIPGNSPSEGLANGDGWRCAYSDPDWVNGNPYNQDVAATCFPNLTLAQADRVAWQVDGVALGSPDGGRAWAGSKSMYYGVWITGGFTEPVGSVETAATRDLINLNVNDSELTFWHQVSNLDDRTLNIPNPLRSAERGVVQIKLFDGNGTTELSDWMNLAPAQNSYSTQGWDFYFNCTYDPTDDGTTEDNFFDPTDPDRRLGPSSTCHPEFAWSYMGATSGAFNVNNIGHATVPPGVDEDPDFGDGTWVKSKVNLSQFRGRRVKIRYLVAGLQGDGENYVEWFETLLPEDSRDDGWWIDQVEVSGAYQVGWATFDKDDFVMGTCDNDGVTACIAQCQFELDACSSPADCTDGAIAVEPCVGASSCGEATCVKAGSGNDEPAPPPCGDTCTSITANAFITPDEVLNPATIPTAAPGQVVTIDGQAPTDLATGATPSVADACLSGTLQFQFCRDGDALGDGPAVGDGDCDDDEDLLLRSWTENGLVSVAPQATADYTMQVRCSTEPETCVAFHKTNLAVDCPTSQNALGLKAIRAVSNAAGFEWSGPLIDVDVWVSEPYTKSSQLAGYDDGAAGPGFLDYETATRTYDIKQVGITQPGVAEVIALLVKNNGDLNTLPTGFFCNSKTWRSGGPAEVSEDTPGRDASLGDPTPGNNP